MRLRRILVPIGLVAVSVALAMAHSPGAADPDRTDPDAAAAKVATDQNAAAATFAGGCFWCVEEAFDEVRGVGSTTSGYTGGRVPDPSYEQVSGGGTGHLESVQVIYDPSVVSYERLLEVFWRNIDPTDGGGQFCDRGDSYRSAIFYRNEEQKRLAEASKRDIERARDFDVVTPILPAQTFYSAEEYHQNYHRKNPLRYKFYKWNCGRAQRLERLWGDEG